MKIKSMTLEKKKKEGGGVGGSLDVPWRCWPAAVVVEDEPFLFFEGSAI